MDTFETPEKRSDGSYVIRFTKSVGFDVELRWEKDALYPTPDLRVQSAINVFREKTLKDLTKNKILFKTAPSLSALTGITPMWGILLHGEAMDWSRQDIWEKQETGAVVTLVGKGIVLSRQSIVPIWGVQVRRVLPDAAVIDLDFGADGAGGADGDDGTSVHSEDMVSEEGVVALRDPNERKRQIKGYVRELLEKAAQAKMDADDAMDRFFSEFDLSEDESDFSEYED